MKSVFIKLPFDRLKNNDLSSLYSLLFRYLSNFDSAALHLDGALMRMKEQKSLLKKIEPKTRKLHQKDNLDTLRKQRDELITALMLHIKALKRANFIEMQKSLLLVYKPVRKIFQNAIHESIQTREDDVSELLSMLTHKEMYTAFETLGLLRYKIAFEENTLSINTITSIHSKIKNENKVGASIEGKELIVNEIQILLRTIDLNVITFPENDYKLLIGMFNKALTDNRAQLRNRATRKITAMAKASKNNEVPNTASELESAVEPIE